MPYGPRHDPVKERRYSYNREYHFNSVEGLKKDRQYMDSQKAAWQAVSDSLPDDAFGDNVNVGEPVGTVRRPETHTPSQLFNYSLISS